MLLCISSLGDALSVAVVALSQISRLYFNILSCQFKISKLCFFYILSLQLLLLAGGAGAPGEQGQLTDCPCSVVVAGAAIKGEESSAERAAN